MRGTPITYKNFTVYPEYCELKPEQLRQNSLDGKVYISTFPTEYNLMIAYHKGKERYTRPKYRLYSTENVKPGLTKPQPILLGSTSVLPLICYELMFPEDYLDLTKKVDLIIHMVGFPMYDENQKEGWQAVQKTLSLIYDCPLVCCCGGEQGPMNITGVING